MACDQTEKRPTEYLGEDMPAADRLEFEQHMLSCGDCTAEVANTLLLDRSLRTMRNHFQPSPDFKTRVLDSSRPSPLQRELRVRKSLRNLMRFEFAWSAIAAAVLAVALLLPMLAYRHEQGRRLVAEISDIHAATLASANPVDVVSSNRHVVKPWFEGKLPFAFNVPELANTGFSLDGARLVYVRQQPGAELLLHYGLHRCSIFIFQDGPAFSRALSRVGDGPFHLEMQRRNGLIFFAIGDLDQEPLRNLGKTFAAAQ
jgi:anti-sigma factor RsiW